MFGKTGGHGTAALHFPVITASRPCSRFRAPCGPGGTRVGPVAPTSGVRLEYQIRAATAWDAAGRPPLTVAALTEIQQLSRTLERLTKTRFHHNGLGGTEDHRRGPAHRGNDVLGVSGDTVLEKIEAADFTLMLHPE